MQWQLLKLRKEHNLSQEKMSKIARMSVVSYGKKERGEIQFSSDEMFSLKEYFGLPMEQIFLPRNFTQNEEKEVSN
ncbi:helix-turn-helix transcriptional regulator [Virgibacillus sp. C22-A2]|uniref:Helix-turn-helix transcriptional regulator n=1 Tax=Virgibacillus tibetensis TaxID=3042313 RepID=A0ABU6KAF6_9BACI|nr:helix-turn-helix transcriptional regulator [Virgibacillus sp. C22-A2]